MSDKCVDLGELPNGAHLYREPDGVGGYKYFSDEVGCGVIVWITSLVSEGTLLAAMTHEHKRVYDEAVAARRQKLDRDMSIEQAAATGGSFIPERDDVATDVPFVPPPGESS